MFKFLKKFFQVKEVNKTGWYCPKGHFMENVWKGSYIGYGAFSPATPCTSRDACLKCHVNYYQKQCFYYCDHIHFFQQHFVNSKGEITDIMQCSNCSKVQPPAMHGTWADISENENGGFTYFVVPDFCWPLQGCVPIVTRIDPDGNVTQGVQ